MVISYAITTHNETEEINKLLEFLVHNTDAEDEIVILDDYSDEKTQEVFTSWIAQYGHTKTIKLEQRKLNRNFSAQKNYLNSMCDGDYIFNIDADEMPHPILISQIKQILEINEVDLIWLPRVNTVKGLTEEHIKKWGWNVTEKGWVNYPDYQARVYKNCDYIKWIKPVHERIDGHKSYSHLPPQEELSLYHHKEITKQEQQNNLYENINVGEKVDKYNLYSVINSIYMKFGKIWINSIYDKLDLDKIDNIFLVDTGLKPEDIEYFKQFDKVKIIESGIDTSLEGGVHGKDWLNTVKMKTKKLMDVIDEYSSYPIIMSDLDCMFVKDIYHHIDTKYDIQACFRGWNHQHSPYLASFTIVNNSNGRNFLEKWNGYIDSITTPNKESPALTKTVKLHSDIFTIGDVEESIVNARNISEIDSCDIVHFKSGHSVPTIEQRIKESIDANGFGEYVKKYLGE